MSARARERQAAKPRETRGQFNKTITSVAIDGFHSDVI